MNTYNVWIRINKRLFQLRRRARTQFHAIFIVRESFPDVEIVKVCEVMV